MDFIFFFMLIDAQKRETEVNLVSITGEKDFY